LTANSFTVNSFSFDNIFNKMFLISSNLRLCLLFLDGSANKNIGINRFNYFLELLMV